VRRDAVTCSPACREKRHLERRATTPPFPSGPFDLVLVDLPLRFDGYSAKGEGRSPQHHYPTMDVAALSRMPVPDLLAKKAAVWGVFFTANEETALNPNPFDPVAAKSSGSQDRTACAVRAQGRLQARFGAHRRRTLPRAQPVRGLSSRTGKAAWRSLTFPARSLMALKSRVPAPAH